MTPGIRSGVAMGEYLLMAGLSASRINTLLQYSPFHAYHDEGGEPSEVSDIGTAIHSALLEGVDNIVTIDAEDWRTKDAKAARDAARAAGKIPMLARKVSQVMSAVEAAKRYISSSEIAGVFDDGKPEQTVIWKEGEMLCKARPDWLTNDRSLLLHVKTTAGSAQPDSWIRNMLTGMGYDVAASFYERGCYQAKIETKSGGVVQSVFLVIEQSPPYGCSLIGLDLAMQDLAARKVERAIATWQRCKATGIYPAYPSRICYAAPKPWELEAEETREFTATELEGGIPA